MSNPLHGLRSNPLLWLLAAVPAVFIGERVAPESHTLLFVLAVLAIVPLAALLSHATESVAAKTGDAVGGLLNATLGNLTELVIAITALRAGMFDLVKASIAGAIVTNSLFMLGMAFLLGGLKHRVQEYNAGTARLQSGIDQSLEAFWEGRGGVEVQHHFALPRLTGCPATTSPSRRICINAPLSAQYRTLHSGSM